MLDVLEDPLRLGTVLGVGVFLVSEPQKRLEPVAAEQVEAPLEQIELLGRDRPVGPLAEVAVRLDQGQAEGLVPLGVQQPPIVLVDRRDFAFQMGGRADEHLPVRLGDDRLDPPTPLGVPQALSPAGIARPDPVVLDGLGLLALQPPGGHHA